MQSKTPIEINEYVPYSEEWAREMEKMPKKYLIENFLRPSLLETQELRKRVKELEGLDIHKKAGQYAADTEEQNKDLHRKTIAFQSYLDGAKAMQSEIVSSGKKIG